MNENELKRLVAGNLCYFRKQRGLTQQQVAEKLNYSDKSVSKWERGEAIPDLYVLLTLAALYEVSLDDLVSPRDEKKLEAERQEQTHRKTWRRGLVTAMSAGLVFLVAVLVFAVLRVAAPDFAYAAMAFVYALPVAAIVMIVFSCLWWGNALRFLSVGALAWMLAASLFLTWRDTPNIGSLFYIAAAFTVLEILWFLYRRFRRKTGKK